MESKREGRVKREIGMWIGREEDEERVGEGESNMARDGSIVLHNNNFTSNHPDIRLLSLIVRGPPISAAAEWLVNERLTGFVRIQAMLTGCIACT